MRNLAHDLPEVGERGGTNLDVVRPLGELPHEAAGQAPVAPGDLLEGRGPVPV